MNINDEQLNTLRSALIEGRKSYCRDQCEHGGDGMQDPEPSIKAAMEILGMQWAGDLTEIFHGEKWTGNEHLKPSA